MSMEALLEQLITPRQDTTREHVVQRMPPSCWFRHQFGPWVQVSHGLQKKTCLRCGVYRHRWRDSVSRWLI